MKIEKVALSKLKPLETNVRKHGENQIAELIRSLNQFGQTRAIVVDEGNNILIGNGLFFAMQKRGDKDCDIHRITGLSDNQKKKLVLTDNKIYSLGVDDYDNIEVYINELAQAGDFDIAGFDEEVLREMTRSADEIAEDVMSYGVNTDYSPEAGVIAPIPAAQPTVAQSVPQPQRIEESSERQEVRNDRTIICPQCGEVIHID